MFNYSLLEVKKIADKMLYRKETVEKVLRLIDLLDFINTGPLNKFCLMLKGGTAINLVYFDLPRLSVDIDLDYSKNVDRETMQADRKIIRDILTRYMYQNKYTINTSATKSSFALDSLNFTYSTLFGGIDTLKIDINYMNRVHVLDAAKNSFLGFNMKKAINVLTLNRTELYATKVKALIERTTVRDMYDSYNIIINNVIDEFKIFKRIVIFYLTISKKRETEILDLKRVCFEKMDDLIDKRIPQYLLFVIKQTDTFTFKRAVPVLKSFVEKICLLDSKEEMFINKYENGEFRPELLFDEDSSSILKSHPMALWKVKG